MILYELILLNLINTIFFPEPKVALTTALVYIKSNAILKTIWPHCDRYAIKTMLRQTNVVLTPYKTKLMHNFCNKSANKIRTDGKKWFTKIKFKAKTFRKLKSKRLKIHIGIIAKMFVFQYLQYIPI